MLSQPPSGPPISVLAAFGQRRVHRSLHGNGCLAQHHPHHLIPGQMAQCSLTTLTQNYLTSFSLLDNKKDLAAYLEGQETWAILDRRERGPARVGPIYFDGTSFPIGKRTFIKFEKFRGNEPIPAKLSPEKYQ
ncbi:hypothetical protein UY3_14026 [Chelonia mydas]|uniref:Uncharacterized protein n=1 Tax=Chelonia mydas TaxID=8469 RepID=M7B9Q9_CHEMY|nr:hypothetical protein UY3_14026 [Chelonia mydas]